VRGPRSRPDDFGAEPESSSAEPLESRLEFETLIADLSSKFVNLPPGEVDHEIDEALRRVCELLDIDLAVLWQWSAETPDVIAPTHVFAVEEGLQPSEPLYQEHFPWCLQEMLAGRMVNVSTLGILPAEAAVDLESCRLFSIKSNLTLPLSVGGGTPVGCLGLNTLRVARDWPNELVKRLQLVAQVFTNALARKRHELSLKESEERLVLAVDSAGAGVWTLDFRTGLFWATDRGREIFGYSPDEVISVERFVASVHPVDRDLVRNAIERSVRAGEPVNLEYRIIVPGDGGVRWIASRGRSRLNADGELERLMGVSIDISENKMSDEAFRTSEARLKAGAELAALAFYEVDFDNGTAYADDRFREVCGLPHTAQQDLQALEFWLEHLHPDDQERVLDLREQLHDGRLDRLSFEYRYLHPARGSVWIHHLAGVTRRDTAGRAVATYGVLRDITESKRVETELRDLSRRLIRAHEEERAMLARELHDDVTQRLAVLAIDVGRAEAASSGGPHEAAMRSVREGLVRISEDIHSLAYQLHPSVLEELGLVEALRAECDRRARQGTLVLSVDLDPLPGAVGKDAAICLFRVAQEALNNVARHAGACAASVTLRKMDEGLLLAVRDDGVGFDPLDPKRRRSLGLASMRERVELVDGSLDIESTPGRGTEIIAWVPAEGGSS
jgi:two-component system, NarL family, sensor histidine kinase UhpB